MIASIDTRAVFMRFAGATLIAISGLDAQSAQADWPALQRYRKANAELAPPAVGVPRVVFMGNSITEAWAPRFATGIRVVLCSVLPAFDYPWKPGFEPAPKIVALNAWLRAYAATHNAEYADFHSAMADARQGLPKELAADGVHPNDAGYRIMGPIVERAIAAA